jgi:polyketide synthase PksN
VDNQVAYLYKQIKEKKINREDAIKQIKEYKNKHSKKNIPPVGVINENKTSGIYATSLLDKLQIALMQTISELLSVMIEDVDVNGEWNEYGIDQVMLTAFADRINQKYRLELTLSVFYKYASIHNLAVYLLTEHQEVFAKWFRTDVLKPSSKREEDKIIAEIGGELLQERAINYFKKLLSSTIKLPVNRIEEDTPMEKYGIDSIMVMQMTNELEMNFGSLPKTLFFEYDNIRQITGYFLEFYQNQLIGLLGMQEEVAVTIDNNNDSVAVESVKLASRNHRRPRFASLRIESQPDKAAEAADVAIIGVSGRYPGARNIQEFWKNLRDGKDCITEIPKERWDHSKYFDEDKKKFGKTYSKWGGFLEGIDQFDPLFFNISPLEAQFMDPQERIFLECVFETLEDAGYTRQSLGLDQGFGLGGNVGVFVGVMYEEYQLYGAQEQVQDRPVALAGSASSIANRVSYFCNFHGPSMAIDTMCSSSLTAIHLACQSLQQDECEIAIAGGVNISIHVNKYLMLGQGKMLSSKGRCQSFGQGGDGYVPGEGVGAVLLKPLAKAIVDGDHIYGIIKATAINHGGKSNGYTVPNPNAQASVIGRVFKKAGINPRTISYIEAQATGTSLGDPIEIAGLNKAFQEYTKDKQFCAIGTAKSNIGHCESASGIAGVTKVLLQLKNRQLVPSLHSKTLNPNIDFSNTPFVVQQKLGEWKRPLIEGQEIARRAGVSAFGAGGSNAHVIIEEYIPSNEKMPPIAVNTRNAAIILLSAKNRERLKEQVQRLLTAIQEEQFSDLVLSDIAYTLQVGRDAMEERLAIIVNSIKELEGKLVAFLEGEEGIEDLHQGHVRRSRESMAVFMADEDLQEVIEKWVKRKKYPKLLDLWVNGLSFDWNKLYQDSKPCKISLPTYPFAKEHYWVPKFETKLASREGANLTIAASAQKDLKIEELNLKSEASQQINSGYTLEYITKIVQDILGLPSNFTIDPQMQLIEYGMNSISGIQLLDKLKRESGIQLDGRQFFSEFTLQEIINQVELVKQSIPNQNKILLLPWEMDKNLPKNLILKPKVIPFKHSSSLTKVFLTGATGLLGAFLCNEILKQTSATVYCLVRAETDSLGLKRIQDNFSKYRLWQTNYQSRIIPILGDITKTQLGIEEKLYNELSQSIERIYHCAAIPNHILNYRSLKGPNVNGTVSIIEFAANIKVKAIHYISTIGVCSQVDGDIVLPAHQSETLLEHGKHLSNGYAQTKWVSENYLLQAQEQGIPVTIFRCGEITGSSQTGYGIAEDMVHNFLKIFSEVTVIPHWDEGVIDFVPIDYVTQAILAVSSQKNCYGKIYHVSNVKPIPINDFFEFLQKKKPALSKVCFEEWADCCLRYIIGLPESSMKTILKGFFTKLNSGHRVFEYYFNNMNLNTENIQKALQNTEVHFPQMDEKWWEKCMNQISLFK